ncbi:anhydro-N-acetylmuramic acid kinase [Sporosarcina sp. Sa2YVA2]|uniref:Anhydro-N-acetylmuramic acid kinase n=2 Tax=Sporosarcina quadrami TaxID=2762234 RepID=A0ABR8U9Q8_9BACL|nr:anhydro-N-acetylmuramic acid kinase [Sporosarcina quadrami]
MNAMRVCGLMSGTSLDGLDIAIVDFSFANNQIQHDLLYFKTVSYEESLKSELHSLMNPMTPLRTVSSMNMYLGEFFADELQATIKESTIDFESIDLISSHGQTIWHEPSTEKDSVYTRPNTMQIGDISVIAQRTGKTTIGDFRTRDMAAGGQGAPLVPFADQLLFQSEEKGRILLNIGGIANITVLAPAQSEEEVIAYDTGPGNMIIDACVAKYTNGQKTYDESGMIASTGKVNREWLNDLMKHDYFHADIPKTTGRELFGTAYVEKLWRDGEKYNCSHADIIATATMLTATSIAKEIQKYGNTHEIKEVIASGGGVHNLTLMSYITEQLPARISLLTSEDIGVNADAKEAFVFALLGYLGVQKQPNSLPVATGASMQTIMGKIAWGNLEVSR